MSPAAGVALVTKFLIACDGFTDAKENLPLRYAFADHDEGTGKTGTVLQDFQVRATKSDAGKSWPPIMAEYEKIIVRFRQQCYYCTSQGNLTNSVCTLMLVHLQTGASVSTFLTSGSPHSVLVRIQNQV